MNDRQLTIVGVTPERFQGTVTMLTFDLWVPATMAPDLFAGSRELEDRSQRGYNVAGRFAPTATRKAAQSELDVAMGQLAHDYPESNRTMSGEHDRSGRRRADRNSSSSVRWRCYKGSRCCSCSRSAATPPT